MRIKKNGQRYDQDLNAQDYKQDRWVGSLAQVLNFYGREVASARRFLSFRSVDFASNPELDLALLTNALTALAALEAHLAAIGGKP